MKFGSNAYFLVNLSIHLSNTLEGTTIIVVLPEVEKDAMYWKRSNAILCAKANLSSTPEYVISRFCIVESLKQQ